jgi:hypothetical protein
VVIGHVDFARGVDAGEIAETLRTYNSHQTRIEVITFDQLLAGAEQALNFVGSSNLTGEGRLSTR